MHEVNIGKTSYQMKRRARAVLELLCFCIVLTKLSLYNLCLKLSTTLFAALRPTYVDFGDMTNVC